MYFLFVLALGIKIVALQRPEDCPECDPNDYHPVCSRGKAYYSICKLKREMCLQQFAENYIYYGECKVYQPQSGVFKRNERNSGQWHSLIKMLVENIDQQGRT